ncbi:branched-chain amino acid transaminase [Anaerolineae bacterium CFX9]|nr:branched-chain amino acid transaminase [Kamptonema cortianum]MDL1901659.1 branched-chain amino acid transaminase [Anaerolineae bacterium CFX9]
MPAKVIWKNGEFIGWDSANVHITTHALHYGSSVFEGIRAYATPKGPALFRLGPHMQRLINSCKIAKIDLPYTVEELNQAAIETVRRNEHDSCYMRPIVLRGAGPLGVEGRKNPVDTYIFTLEWGRYLGKEAIEQGVDVQISSWRRIAPDTFASLAKIGGQYVNSQFISMEAHDNGFSEGIALDYNGYVSEGAGENIFVIHDGVVYTPGPGSSILLGITRDSVLTILRDLGYTVRYEAIPREMLYIADEIFFTGTAAEVTPIRSIDRIQIGSGSRGPITKAVQDEFFAITTGKKEDPYGWLTVVPQLEPGA